MRGRSSSGGVWDGRIQHADWAYSAAAHENDETWQRLSAHAKRRVPRSGRLGWTFDADACLGTIFAGRESIVVRCALAGAESGDDSADSRATTK